MRLTILSDSKTRPGNESEQKHLSFTRRDLTVAQLSQELSPDLLAVVVSPGLGGHLVECYPAVVQEPSHLGLAQELHPGRNRCSM